MALIDGNISNILSNTSLLSGGNGAASMDVKDNYLDQNSLNSVKAMGRKNDPQALKEIAKKFEGMFVAQMLKSMREANEVFAEGDMLNSQEEKFHQDMLDQQMVLNLTSGKGIGLATSMYQQMQKMYGRGTAVDGSSPDIKPLLPAIKSLSQHVNATTTEVNDAVSKPAENVPPLLISRAALNNSKVNKPSAAKTPEEFIASLMPFAEKAAADLNVNTDVILAQAALETGWGKHMLHDRKGNNSFNVFNIKKSADWDGKTVGASSLEYDKGTARMEHSHFRQYDDYTQSFSDYVDMMKNTPRYQRVLDAGNNSADYAEALQKAGYATDPAYAKKLKSIMNSDAIRSAVNTRTIIAKADDISRG